VAYYYDDDDDAAGLHCTAGPTLTQANRLLICCAIVASRRGKLWEIEFYARPEAIIAVTDYRVQGAL